MPINSSHEFTPEEISLIESTSVETRHDSRRVTLYLTVADVREALADWSVNAEGGAELELDTAITIAIDKLKGKNFILSSYLDNEVSDEEARPVADEDIQAEADTEADEESEGLNSSESTQT